MSGRIKVRLIAFVLAIAGMMVSIAWTAHNAWWRAGELRKNLTAVQLKSFQIADHLQQTILELNNSVLRYGAYGDPKDWAHFARLSKELDKWIDDERPSLSTEREKQTLDRINTNYDFYMDAARVIESNIRLQGQVPRALGEFADFEKQSQRILKLGFQLAAAHQDSMESFLEESKHSLNYLRALLVGSLALLFCAVGGLAFVVYGEMIAPLRVRLVENQALIERQEKLASLGMLAAGLAHEIRNPLTAIKAWLFIQRKHLEPGTPESNDASIIAQEINRLDRIVKDVLLFARPSEPHLATVHAQELLQQVQILLGPQLEKSQIQLVRENAVQADIRADSQQIQQVLINLIQNAAESIGQNGTITLRLRTETKRAGERSLDQVIIEVEDTGKGISPEVEKRLFDPFFTTKESGTGLGLSIAARILEKHGGSLRYQTQVNHGTTFGLALPRASASSAN